MPCATAFTYLGKDHQLAPVIGSRFDEALDLRAEIVERAHGPDEILQACDTNAIGNHGDLDARGRCARGALRCHRTVLEAEADIHGGDENLVGVAVPPHEEHAHVGTQHP